MPITVHEKPKSRKWLKDERGELVFTVRGTEDDQEALSALVSATAAVRGGLVRRSVDVDPLETGDAWEGTVEYRKAERTPREPLEEGESSGYEFEVGGDTWHITTSKSTRSYGPANRLDFHSAVDVHRDDDGNWHVDGVDLGNTSGAFHWSETKCFAADAVDDDYADLLSTLVWHTNDDTFRGWAAGEVLFTGARGNKRGDDLWEITFSYAVLPTKAANFTIPESGGPEAITVTDDKLGWEYLWVFYGRKPTGSGLIELVPKAVYVEKVYDAADFDTIEPA